MSIYWNRLEQQERIDREQYEQNPTPQNHALVRYWEEYWADQDEDARPIVDSYGTESIEDYDRHADADVHELHAIQVQRTSR